MKKLLKRFCIELYVLSVVIYCILMSVIFSYDPTNTVRILTTVSSIVYFLITFVIMVSRVAKKQKREFNNLKGGV